MSAVIFPRNSSLTISGGAISATVTPPADVNLASYGGSSTANFTIPANAKYVRIENIGGLNPATIQVNTISIALNGGIERKAETDGVNRYLLPVYDIVTNGSLVEYYYET